MYIIAKKLNDNNNLFKHINNNMISRLNNNLDNLPAALNIFSNKIYDLNTDTYTYTRNTSSWLSGIDMTGISISLKETKCMGNFGDLGLTPEQVATFDLQRCAYGIGHLITPKHVLSATHYSGVGNKIKFVNNNNQTISRTTIARYSILGEGDENSLTAYDTSICELDYPVTESDHGIKVLKFLPNDWYNRFEKSIIPQIYIVQSNQFDRFLIGSIGVDSVLGVVTSNVPIFPLNTLYNGYRKGICPIDVIDYNDALYGLGEEACTALRMGDSGHGIFIIINDELCLIGHHTGFNIPTLYYNNFSSKINEALKNEILPTNTYDIQFVDLNNFQKYI